MGTMMAHPGKRSDSSKIKLLLMGNPNVGKSSIVNYFLDSNFNPQYEPTVGCQLLSLNVPFNSKQYQLLVMDSLADADLTLNCRLKSIQNTETIAIVFDLTNPESWEDVKEKLKIIKENYYSHSHVILVGNKNDLEKKVEDDEINNFVKNFQEFQLEYFECSAKSGENIQRVFERALELGYYTSKFRWEKIKAVLFVYKFVLPEEQRAGFSWGNLCEALPQMIKKKRKNNLVLNRLPPEVIKRLIHFL